MVHLIGRSCFQLALVVAVGSLSVTSASSAVAQTRRLEVVVSPAEDITTTSALGAVLVSTELAKPLLAPKTAYWQTPGPFDRSVREGLVWSNPSTAAILSDIALFGIAPASAAGLTWLAAAHDQRAEDTPADLLLIGQAVFASGVLTQLVKHSAGRARPYVYFNPSASRGADDNLSFFSGHTSLTFALATSSGVISSLRGYELAPWVWLSGLSIASFTGYARIAADKHYASDVLTGAFVGSLVGVALPLLHLQSAPSTSLRCTAPCPETEPMWFSVAGEF